MALNNDDQKRIRKYLLGHLTEAEQGEIEERLFTDDDLSEELEVSKDEVIEDYIASELSRKERRWLEQHFLASPEGRQRHRFAVALDRVNTRPAQGLSLIGRFQELWRSQPFAVAALASAIVVIVVGLTMVIRREQVRPVVAATLSNSTYTRGKDDSQSANEIPPATKVFLPPNTGELRLTLPIPEPATPEARYRAELVDVVEALTITNHDPKSVTVTIPAAQLQPGDYALRLYRVKTDGGEERIPGSYFFVVE